MRDSRLSIISSLIIQIINDFSSHRMEEEGGDTAVAPVTRAELTLPHKRMMTNRQNLPVVNAMAERVKKRMRTWMRQQKL